MSEEVDIQKHIKTKKVKDLKKYPENPKKHPKNQIKKIADSIKEFGFTVPLIIKNNEIIAGHGRIEAAKELGLKEVPVIERDDLTDEQAKAFRIADNKLTESDWEDNLLREELKKLKENNYNLNVTGFSESELNKIFESQEGSYTDKIEPPTYEPKGEKPEIKELVNTSKTEELRAEIEESELNKKEKEFLLKAAERHNRFDYEKIADFYAHSRPEVQELMEKSALVIIDFEDAVENGYIEFIKEAFKNRKKDEE